MRKHLTIPECRSMLQVIARELHLGTVDGQAAARRIRIIIRHMKRRPPVRMTKVKSVPVTPAVKALIRKLAATTDDSQAEIARQAGVNAGRVSEALAGKRR